MGVTPGQNTCAARDSNGLERDIRANMEQTFGVDRWYGLAGRVVTFRNSIG
jgi:hypothetical protein